jgi:hypothetical protein
LPGGGLGNLSRDGKTVAVCQARAGGALVVSAGSGPGDFPLQHAGEEPAPAAPESVSGLAANPGFRWPA